MDVSIVIHQNNLLILIKTHHLRKNFILFHHTGDSKNCIIDTICNRRNRISECDTFFLVCDADNSWHICYCCLKFCRVFIPGIRLYSLQYLSLCTVCLLRITLCTIFFLCIFCICPVRCIGTFSCQSFQCRIRFFCGSFLCGLLL